MMLSGYATILQDVSNHFEHLQPLCCPSHPRFLNSPMLFLWATLSTLIGLLRYSVALICMLELVL